MKIKEGYFREIGNKYFERIDTKTGEIVGYAVFNFTKRKEKFLDLDITLPESIMAES